MCGILGITPSCEEHVFKRGLDSISHRGPDGYGIWQSDDRSITLGHRRLAILDLTDQGKQPMHYQRFAITFNGEIYNFLEVRNELIGKGFHFHTESDTEVILAAFQEWKQDCLHKFNGMWALAIWDKVNKELFISRDRFGKKPLFYSFVGDQFVFGSEMKALFPFLPEVGASEDFKWCSEHMFDYESTDKCLIAGIKRFPAGHYAFFKAGQREILPKRFWNTIDHLHEVPKTYGEQVEKFRELFIDACKLRMRSDVSIGTALSGGLDSSATISTMAYIARSSNADKRVNTDWQHAFVATFPGTALDERYYAEKVVDHLGIKATFLPIDAAGSIQKLQDYFFLFEELYITSPVPMMETYAAVRKNGVVVTIDGHGADELMVGYGRSVYEAFHDAGINIFEIKNILNTYKGIIGDKPDGGWKNYLQYMANKHSGGKNALMHLLKGIFSSSSERPSEGKLGEFNQMLYVLFHNTVLPTLLRNYDRYSMASGVEIRMPFMDHRLVSYCFSLPWQSKMRNGYTKSILRDALQDLLPAEVAWRKSKIGFNTPIVDWMKGDWKEFLQDELSSDAYRNCNLIDTEKAKKMVFDVINGSNPSFREGELAWAGLIPYFWEKAMIRSVR